MLDEYDRPVRMKAGRVSIGKAPAAAPSPPQQQQEEGEGEEREEGERQDVDEVPEITVQESIQEMVGGEQQQAVLEDADVRTLELKRSEGNDGEEQPQPNAEEEDDMETQKQPQLPLQPQLAPWEVRREDMQEDKAAGSPEEEGEGEGEGEKPTSKAERRRLIKEEIHRLAQGGEPLYYQRRLW